MDQRVIESRSDYLRFETPALNEDLTLAGAVSMDLWAATSSLDTDFMIKLVDVYPNGYEAIILDGGLRTRFRKGRRQEDLAWMTPGEPEKLTIDLWHTGIVLEAGHKLAIHISSSNYPRFDVNTGGAEAGEAASSTGSPIRNTVFHSAEHPSFLRLPVLQDSASIRRSP